MRIRNIIIGFIVGLFGGTILALFNTHKSGPELQSSLTKGGTPSQMIQQVKSEFNNAKANIMATSKDTPETFKTLTEEVKGLITNYKSDIDSNIENIQGNIENLKNRGESIQKDLEENPPKFIKKK